MTTTPRRPYLLRAMYEWMVDNDLTPHLVLDATIAGVIVPQQFAKEEALRLSIGPAATRDLMLENDCVGFTARINGKVEYITVPQIAILGILSRETNEGLFFDEEDYPPDTVIEQSEDRQSPTLTSLAGTPSDDTPDDEPPKGRPSLRVVK